ncbi:hypothetical protein C8R44DRAFT_819349 [Mycena epipterygia]|nr:hypothetical protein C8R44DRAFT_819349 [Mycena epipterygia]
MQPPSRTPPPHFRAHLGHAIRRRYASVLRSPQRVSSHPAAHLGHDSRAYGARPREPSHFPPQSARAEERDEGGECN